MSSGIYRIFCGATGKNYIGQSKNIENRWIQHKSELKNNSHINYKLQEDYNTYGLEEFEFSILKEDEEEFLNVLESHFIQVYDSIENGYNIRNENGKIKNRFKINSYELEEENRLEKLERTPIKLNLRELVLNQFISVTDTAYQYYGSSIETDEGNEELIWESDEFNNLMGNCLRDKRYWYSRRIINDTVEDHVKRIIEPSLKVKDVYIALDYEGLYYPTEGLEIIKTITVNKKLPLQIIYEVKDIEKEMYLEIPIEDNEPMIDNKSWHNCEIKVQIEQLKRELIV